MSDDLIRRSDAIKTLCDINNESDMPEDWHRGISVSISALHRVPSVDIPQSDDWEKYSDKLWKLAYERGKASVRPQGEWIDMGDFEQCSVCKGTRLKEFQSYYGKTTWVKTPYCPSCGAQMKGADDEDA